MPNPARNSRQSPSEVDLPDPLAKDRPLLLHVGAILLAGAQRLLLHQSPSRRRVRHGVGRLTGGRPVRSAKRSAYSSSVRSFRSATSARNSASPAGSIPSARPPACGLAHRPPSARPWRRQRDTVERPTPKRRATTTGSKPASYASVGINAHDGGRKALLGTLPPLSALGGWSQNLTK